MPAKPPAKTTAKPGPPPMKVPMKTTLAKPQPKIIATVRQAQAQAKPTPTQPKKPTVTPAPRKPLPKPPTYKPPPVKSGKPPPQKAAIVPKPSLTPADLAKQAVKDQKKPQSGGQLGAKPGGKPAQSGGQLGTKPGGKPAAQKAAGKPAKNVVRQPPAPKPKPAPKTSSFLSGLTKSLGASVTGMVKGAVKSVAANVVHQVKTQAVAVAREYATALQAKVAQKVNEVVKDATGALTSEMNKGLGSLNRSLGLGNIQIPAGSAPGVPGGGDPDVAPEGESDIPPSSPQPGEALQEAAEPGTAEPEPSSEPVEEPTAVKDPGSAAVAPHSGEEQESPGVDQPVPKAGEPLIPKFGDFVNFETRLNTPVKVRWNDLETGDAVTEVYYHNDGTVTSQETQESANVDIFIANACVHMAEGSTDIEVDDFTVNHGDAHASGTIHENMSFGVHDSGARYIVIDPPDRKLLHGCVALTAEMESLQSELRGEEEQLNAGQVTTYTERMVQARGESLQMFGESTEPPSMTDQELEDYRIAERNYILKLTAGTTDTASFLALSEVGQ